VDVLLLPLLTAGKGLHVWAGFGGGVQSTPAAFFCTREFLSQDLPSNPAESLWAVQAQSR
jgi:hypothetical protein